MLRRLQALIRVQDRARANRAQNIDSNHSPQSRENATRFEVRAESQRLEDSPVLKKCGSKLSMRERTHSGMNWLDNWVEVGSSMKSPSSMKLSCLDDDEKSDKILEVDSWRPRPRPRSRSSRNLQPSQQIISAQDYHNHSFAASDYLARYSPNDLLHNNKPNGSPFAEDVASLKSLNFPLETYNTTVEMMNSPQQEANSVDSKAESITRRSSPMTPMREELSRSFWSNGFPSPSYMANTESYRAKVRCSSVPRQRGDRKSKRSLHAFWESKTSSKRNVVDPLAD